MSQPNDKQERKKHLQQILDGVGIFAPSSKEAALKALRDVVEMHAISMGWASTPFHDEPILPRLNEATRVKFMSRRISYDAKLFDLSHDVGVCLN